MGGRSAAGRPVLYHTFSHVVWEIHIFNRIFKRNTNCKYPPALPDSFCDIVGAGRVSGPCGQINTGELGIRDIHNFFETISPFSVL